MSRNYPQQSATEIYIRMDTYCVWFVNQGVLFSAEFFRNSVDFIKLIFIL